MAYTIKTNNQIRQSEYYPTGNRRKDALIEKQYGGLIDLQDAEFVFYRGNPYYMGDCMRINDPALLANGWDGIFQESFFSAVLVKMLYHEEGYIFGLCLS